MASEVVDSDIQRTEVLPVAEVADHRPASDHPPASDTPERTALFPPEDGEEFRSRWRDIQGAFVDEPRRAVEQANALVGHVSQRLADVFTNERAKLENTWGQGKDVSTEDLRQALRRYRSFFDRLLSV